MSDEPTPPPAPEVPPLPAKISTTAKFSFEFPHILIAIGVDASGFISRQIREGGTRQVDFTTEIEYAETPPEPETPFVVRGVNRVPYGGGEIAVLNDEINISGVPPLPATSPTASEYLARIGQPILVHYACTRDRMLSANRERLGGKPAYRITRTTVILL